MTGRRRLPFDKWSAECEQFMRLGNIYPDKAKNWTVAWCSFMVLVNGIAMALLPVTIYIYLYDMDKLANALHHWLLISDVTILAVFMLTKRDVIQTLITEMKTTYMYGDWFDRGETRRFHSTRINWNKKAVIGLWFLLIYTSTIIIILAVVEKYIEGNEMIMLFPCWVPFSLKNPVNRFFFIMWQVMAILVTVLSLYAVLGLLFNIHYFIYFELSILMAALNKLKVINQKMNVRLAVNQCASHHQSIINFMKDADKILHLVILMVLTSGVATMTICGLAIVSDNNSVRIKFSGIMVVELSFLYACCRMSQNIRDASTRIKDACYDVDWMAMDRGSSRCLQIMVERSFKPLTFKSMTGHHLSLDVYMNMVKAAYSYFNMLLTQK